ncbi:MAG: transglycosylase family protein [Patescibacteria group bacterium]|nr:transglycosylase family protein [Patescibacteria group bacterium]
MPTETFTPIPTVIPTSQITTDPTNDSVWDQLATCESNNHWDDDTGNGYYGGLQFSLSAWVSVGGIGKPSDASRDDQIAKGKLLQARRGWSPWGACSRKLGLQ